MRAYRIVARVKNNRLWTAITDLWPDVTTQADAARRLDIRVQDIGRLLNMKEGPGLKDGGWSQLAQRVAKRLGHDEAYLFDRELYGKPAQKIEFEVDRPALEAAGVLALPPSPEEAFIAAEGKARLNSVLATLTPRERAVLRQRFGVDDGHEHTLAEVGKAHGVTHTRIMQIESNALRKLRHPSRAKKIREWFHGGIGPTR